MAYLPGRGLGLIGMPRQDGHLGPGLREDARDALADAFRTG